MITCFFENQRKAFLRHVVVDSLVIKNNKILLVKRAPQSVSGNKYALPGGFLNRNETIKQAVLREIKEETGYQATIINLLTVIDNPRRQGEDRQNISFVFIAAPQNKITSHDHEVTEIKWFNLDQLPPAEEIAFDHYQIINLYLKTRQKNIKMPILDLF